MCEVMTDNRNRTTPELRSMFGKFGGNIGNTGCVSYLFERKGLFVFDPETADEEKLTEIALENGGDDVEPLDDGKIQVTCNPDVHQTLADAFAAAELEPEISSISQIAQTMVEVDGSMAKSVLRLLEALDDHDDVQNVSTNLNITDEMFED